MKDRTSGCQLSASPTEKWRRKVACLASVVCLFLAAQANGIAQPTPPPAPNASAPTAGCGNPAQFPPDQNLTFHQNNCRWGWYRAETALTPATVGSPQFMRVTTISGSSFGKIYAQPLLIKNVELVGGSSANLMIIAAADGTVYAYDEANLTKTVWQTDLATAQGGGPQRAGDLRDSLGFATCGDVNPYFAIVATPVIDPELKRLYVAVATREQGQFHLRLHSLDLRNGSEISPGPVEITGSASSGGRTYSVSPQWNFSRAALLESKGKIYIALASHCDWHQEISHGWLLSFDREDLHQTGNLFSTTLHDPGNGHFLGSIWMSGFGPAADLDGNVFFATGNGPYDGRANFGMAVVRAPENLDLTQVDSFSPSFGPEDSNNDQDLGSGGLLLFPNGSSPTHPHLLLQGGKCSPTACWKWVLDQDNLGRQTPNDSGAVWHDNTAGWMWGGPAFFEDSDGNELVAYGGSAPGVQTRQGRFGVYRLDSTAGALSLLTSTTAFGCLECRNLGGSQPVVSSNSTAMGTAIVWALKTPRGGGGGTINLLAFDPRNMANPIANLPVGPWTKVPPSGYIGGAFISPLVADGRVYVPFDGGVAVFGLTATGATPAPVPTPTVVLQAQAASTNATILYGAIQSIKGNTMTLRLESGAEVLVDITALKDGVYSAGSLKQGRFVSVGAKLTSPGHYMASSVTRAYQTDLQTPRP